MSSVNSSAAEGVPPLADHGAGSVALPPEVPPVISVRQVNHYFGEGEARKQALFDNNLEVGPGEIVIMTGPSGSGKTTLLTLIGALRTVQEGSLQVLGRELTGLETAQQVEVRKGIGFIFQAHNLFESLTAYRNVRMAMELKDISRTEMDQRITELLTTLGLAHRIHYKPDHLSGGQRQRVAIARALANRPRLILADEPTAALDEESGRVVVNLLRKLAKEELCTSVIVTHDNRILDVADRIINMVDGRIRSNVLVKEMFPLCQFLRSCVAFSGLTPSALVIVADKMMKEKFPAGTVVFRQGDQGDKLYLIWRGSVDIIDDKGGGRILARQKPGDFFGEMALISGTPRTATVVVREPLEAYTLGKADFDSAVKASPPFEKELYKVFFARQ